MAFHNISFRLVLGTVHTNASRVYLTENVLFYYTSREKTGNEAEPVGVHTGLFCFCIRFHDTESKIH